jgi:septal ring factor EnvC (AmiA/AmiB activator)
MIRRTLLCAVTVASVSLELWAQSPTRVPTDEGSRGVAEELSELQAESTRLVEQARTILAELRELEAERDLQMGRLRDAQAAVVEGQAAVERTAERLLALEAQRFAQLPALEAQLVDIYKRGRVGYAKLVLSAGGIREFGRAARAVAAMLRVSGDRVTRHRATIAAVVQQRTALEAELEMRRAREADAQRAQAAVTRAVANRNALLAKIDARRDVTAQLAGELQVEQARLESQGAARIARSESSTAPEAPAAVRPPEPEILTPLSPLRGELLWPVSGRVTGRFGRQVAEADDPAAANGVEIASREGNPVRALHAGTISFAGPLGRFGNVVIVDHGANTLSVYGYLGSISVDRDNEVESGVELGRVGAMPSGEALLFLEIRIDGRSVDPVQWLRPL